MADDGLIPALEAVVSSDPANVEIRAHLANLLAEAGRPSDALHHALEVLGRRPDHIEMLGVAASACRAAGDTARAESYERLMRALHGERPEASRVTDHRVDPPASEAGTDTELDQFLRKVLDDDEASRVRLADVAGMFEVKRRLELTFFGPMRDPRLRDAFRATLRGGMLLYGPPGCGKTFLARAVAGEIGARFIAVGLHDVLDMWLGNSEKRLHEVFAHARRHAPTVLFFDEVDALGLKRSSIGSSVGRGVIAQLLDELDGATSDNSGVYVLGATNAPWDVDSALRRPGRFDRMMLVAPPDGEARRAILALHLKGRPHSVRDLSAIEGRTEGFSGADLRLVCETAAEFALEDSMHKGSIVPIEIAHLKRALKSVRPSIGPWLDSARNVVAFSNQSGDYDDLAGYLRGRR